MPTLENDTLYHGTSSARWKAIQEDGRMRLALSGDAKISLTPDRSVAEYWADVSASCDLDEGRGDGSAVVLTFSHSSLDAAGLWLTEYSDDIYDAELGEGACDWEQEVACWSPIDARQILSVETVAPLMQEAA